MFHLAQSKTNKLIILVFSCSMHIKSDVRSSNGINLLMSYICVQSIGDRARRESSTNDANVVNATLIGLPDNDSYTSGELKL